MKDLKIAIIGNAGSGKSTFAYQLGNAINIPVYSLDHYYWQPNWERTDKDEFAQIHARLIEQPSWIIEGMQRSVLESRIEKANVVIYLKRSPIVCLYNVIYRYFQECFNGKTFGRPYNCKPKLRLEFIIWILWKFNAKYSNLESYLLQIADTKKIFILHNTQEQLACIETIKKLL